MIGEVIKYSNRDEMLIGEVVDKINIIQEEMVISGYLIKSIKDNILYPIAYWRVKEIVQQ